MKPLQLGFGCASLMGNLGESHSTRLLAAAYEAGITHFDTARLYGYGEAERVLGKFLAGRRDRVSITTKFGIAPPAPLLASGAIKSAARRIAALAPGLRPLLRRGAETMSRHGAFDSPSARASLETSLRALRTDHVDVLLMHECTLEEYSRDDMQRFLEDVRRAGKALRTGVAASAESLLAILASDVPPPGVVQFRSSPRNNLLGEVLARHKGGVFVHSVLGDCFRDAVARVKLPWQAQNGLRLAEEQDIASLLIGFALLANPQGGVIIGSRNPARVAANVAGGAAMANHPPDEIRAAVAELCRAAGL